MLRTRLHQTGVQQVQSMYTHRSKEKFGCDDDDDDDTFIKVTKL